MSRILVVEDVELNRDLLVQLLEDEHDVFTAVDGLEGIEVARRVRPELIVMDLQLPRLDGWEATRRIKADPELGGTVVIALSSHAMPGDEEAARAAGCDDYLSKPLDERLLFAALDRHLGSRPAGAGP